MSALWLSSVSRQYFENKGHFFEAQDNIQFLKEKHTKYMILIVIMPFSMSSTMIINN